MKKLIITLIILMVPLVGFSFEMKCEGKKIKNATVSIYVIRCENSEVVCYKNGHGFQCKFKIIPKETTIINIKP